MMLKPILAITGTISLLFGIAGIFLPVLPTTPFFLLTAGLYIKSSPKLYARVMNNPMFNRYLTGPSESLKSRSRNIAIIIMWTMIILASVSLSQRPLMIILLVVVGITGTCFKIRFFKKYKK